MNKNKVISGLAAFGLAWGFPLGAQAGQTSPSEPKAEASALAQWWNGKYASGNWFGVRDTLEDHGLKLGVEWKANFLWNVDGGLQQRFGYDDEWKFRGTLDFAKFTGWDASRGSRFTRTCAIAAALASTSGSERAANLRRAPSKAAGYGAFSRSI